MPAVSHHNNEPQYLLNFGSLNYHTLKNNINNKWVIKPITLETIQCKQVSVNQTY